MATYGVIADVHGNLEALAAVLEALRGARVDRIVCLGDLVGYNADPDECLRLLEAAGVESIAGNHDLITLRRLGFERCAPKPAFALRRTRRVVDEGTRARLEALPATRSYEAGRVVLVHGGVEDVCLYMTNPLRIAENARLLESRAPDARVCFFGHTHVPKIWAPPLRAEGARPRDRAGAGTVRLDLDEGLHFVNPGSVDAARRNEKLAAFALFDSVTASVTFEAVSYDHRRAEAKARAQGFRMGATERAARQAAKLTRRLGARVAGGLWRALRAVRGRPILRKGRGKVGCKVGEPG